VCRENHGWGVSSPPGAGTGCGDSLLGISAREPWCWNGVQGKGQAVLVGVRTREKQLLVVHSPCRKWSRFFSHAAKDSSTSRLAHRSQVAMVRAEADHAYNMFVVMPHKSFLSHLNSAH